MHLRPLGMLAMEASTSRHHRGAMRGGLPHLLGSSETILRLPCAGHRRRATTMMTECVALPVLPRHHRFHRLHAMTLGQALPAASTLLRALRHLVTPLGAMDLHHLLATHMSASTGVGHPRRLETGMRHIPRLVEPDRGRHRVDRHRPVVVTTSIVLLQG